VEVPDLEAKLLAAVNKHPKGVSLAEVAQSLDVVPVVLGRASSSLLKKGLIRKKEKLYFPVAGE
jgi:predicted transcriptional regulator of viral defense system